MTDIDNLPIKRWHSPKVLVILLILLIAFNVYPMTLLSTIKIIGVSIFSIGMILNGLVMITNKGYMPSTGMTETHGIWTPVTPRTRFPLLCDRILNCVSIGDCFMLIGFGLRLI
jgi:hypothetical protein